MYKRIFDIENKLDEGMFLFGARQTGISATTFSDLLHGRRALSFDIARSLHKVLGVPADIVLA